MTNNTFLTIEEDRVIARFLDESNNTDFQYKINASTNTGSIKLNDRNLVTLQEGLNIVTIKDNKVNLHRTYKIFNSSELSAINTLLGLDVDFVILASTIDLPDVVIDQLRGYSANVVYRSIGSKYIATYKKNFGFAHEIIQYPQANLTFNSILDFAIMYLDLLDEDILIDIHNQVEVSFIVEDGSISINSNEYTVGSHVIYINSDTLEAIPNGTIRNFIIAYSTYEFNTRNSGIGPNGIRAKELQEVDQGNLILSIPDIGTQTNGTWYSDKVNGEWVGEEQNWFVFDKNTEYRDKIIRSIKFEEI